MNDTNSAAAAKFYELMKRKTNEERLLMGCSMFDTSRKIAKSAIYSQYPEIDDLGMKQQFFLKFYGEDFSALQKKRVLQALIKG